MFQRRPRGTSKSTDSRFKSSLEEAIALGLEAMGEPVKYEETVLNYTVPAKDHKYTPDFQLSNGIFIEAKGYLTSDDRTKMKQVHTSNPDLDIRFVFGRATNKLNKRSQTTYAQWAEDHGFLWAEKVIPHGWIQEPKPN